MQHPLVSSFLDQLDLTDPADLILALHHFRHFPETLPLDSDEWERMWPVVACYGPAIFGVADHADTIEAVRELLWQAGGSTITGPNLARPSAPRSWLCIFRHAFASGNIGPKALGAATRMLLVQTGGNGCPGLAADSLSARAVMLMDAMNACPSALMSDAELASLAALPETVTLYRGGSYSGGAALDRAQSMHWAFDRQYALSYTKGRAAQQTVDVALAVLRLNNSTPLEILVKLERPLAAIASAKFLLRAEVPKELVIAYIAAGPNGEQVEAWVDYTRIEASMLQFKPIDALPLAA